MSQAPQDVPFHLRMWGVRGAISTPCVENTGYGGNTTCAEVRSSADELIVLDGGTGIHALGRNLTLRHPMPLRVHIFFTHFHWDHIQGIPFFAPMYSPDFAVTLYSAHPPEVLQAVLTAQMLPPYFPVPWDEFSARIEFREITKTPVDCAGVQISCFPLHHPQGSVGYRVEHPRRKVIFATDHEHGVAAIDRGLREVSRDADVLVYDAQYTPEEHAARKGWGHSTWREAVDVARDAAARRLVLFHHDPDRDDAAVAHIVDQARSEFENTSAAAEGMDL